MTDTIMNMGDSSLLPIAVVLLSVCLGVKIGKAIRSGLMIGAGFVGISLMVEMMNRQLGTAVSAMSERIGVNLSVIDIGWQGVSPMAWASGIAAAAIPVAIFVNIVMLVCGLTRTVNIDIWNIWHMAFTGAIAYVATGNYWIGILGVAVHAGIAYKLGDLWAPYVGGYFELEGLTVPHGTSAHMAPVACLTDIIMDKIPILNRIDFSMDQLQEKAGIFAQPVIIGAVIGSGIGILAGYSPGQAFSLGVEMSAVMILMPQIVKCIMEGLVPLSERAKELLSKHFGGGGCYIGLDPAILLGDSRVVAAGLLFIPLTLVIAMIVPGNRVMPFGDLVTISYFAAIAVAVHRGNLFRTLVSGSVVMYLTIWIANQTVPWITRLGTLTGTIEGNRAVAALDQGGSPITYIFTQIFVRENLGGLLAISVIYVLSIAVTVYYSRQERRRAENS